MILNDVFVEVKVVEEFVYVVELGMVFEEDDNFVKVFVKGVMEECSFVMCVLEGEEEGVIMGEVVEVKWR